MKKLVLGLSLSAIFLVGCKAILEEMDKIPSVPLDYYSQHQSDLPLEAKYFQLGNFSVKEKEISLEGKNFKTLKIWYPTDLETTKNQYAVVVFANGTGVPHYKYEAVFKHLASWGFIAVGNDDRNSWSGVSSAQSLDYLLSENDNPSSIFYQKINKNQIGISGHSQGGVGVINAVTTQANSHLYRSAFGASTTKHALALGLKWPYDISKVKIPYFAVAGMGHFDAGNGSKDSGIAPLHSMIENFNKISSNKLNIRARRKNIDHGDMLYKADGYMTAWFLFTLKNDTEAQKVFIGNTAELPKNPNWQDVEIKP